MYRSLKYIKNRLNQFFKKHSFINSVYNGDIDDLSTIKDINYPLVNINYINTTFGNSNENTSNWEVIIGDLSNEINDFDVIDSMNNIANDFLVALENDEEIEILPNVVIVPFSDDLADRTSGVVFTIRVVTHRNNCKNIIPTNNQSGFDYVLDFDL